MSRHDVPSVREVVRNALAGHPRVVLAISGGLDSMALLDAAAGVARPDRLLVATFDHGTGGAASAAAALVEARAGALGLRAVRGRADRAGRTESEWRAARWAFLESVASAEGAPVCTAHSRDDQVETVLMRELRDAGARGLAGLYADSGILRPFIDLTRADLHAYANARRLTWIEDPSNASRRFLRNRIRHDLLPALRAVHPGIDDELLDVAVRAAAWRRDLDTILPAAAPSRVRSTGGALDVAAQDLASHPAESLAVLWPALAAGVGLVLDRRGTARLVAFTTTARVGARIQLSGGWQVVRSREWFELRQRAAPAPESRIDPRGGRWGMWAFEPATAVEQGDRWAAWLPADAPVYVRAWQPGDVLVDVWGEEVGRTRKVKQLLSAAGVTGHARTEWPVVVAGGQVVWIPGIGRSEAATVRSGRPSLPFRCENLDR